MNKNLALIFSLVLLSLSTYAQLDKPKVFVFTDINIDQGDPDDRQSLIHLLWYTNEVTIQGIVPDRWDAKGYEACMLAMEAYEQDFKALNLENEDYPTPEKLKNLVATDVQSAKILFTKAASAGGDPLYVLVWGNMKNFGAFLNEQPELHKNIRLITIGTDLMMENYRQHMPENWPKTDQPCEQYNWNGFGRNEIFNDPRFNNLWWLEINWTYEGMFSGDEPRSMYQKLSRYGRLGEHMIEVTKNQPWAQYFRVGDTPSVLYVIDPDHNLDDPTESSWAGKFKKPFPDTRPNYFLDDNGPIVWNYDDPCETWENHTAMRDYAKSTLEMKRPSMYASLLEKLEALYGADGNQE